jgi:hypothetical protein
LQKIISNLLMNEVSRLKNVIDNNKICLFLLKYLRPEINKPFRQLT